MLKRTDLIKNFLKVAIITFLGRMLGFAQDKLMINYFRGVSLVSDAFLISFRIPNMLSKIIGDGLVGAALVPIVIQLHEEEQFPRAKRLLTFFFFLVFITLGTFSFWVYRNPLVIGRLLSPGFSVEQFFYMEQFLPKMFFFLLFFSSYEVLSAGLKAISHFFLPSLGPALNTLIFIITIILANNYAWHNTSLAYSISFGAAFNFALRLIAYFFYGLSFSLPTKETLSDAYFVFLKMIPLLLGFGILQTFIIFEGIIGSFLATGEISLLHYSWRLINIPTMIFQTMIMTVLLPYFARASTQSLVRLNFFFLEIIKLFFWIVLPLAIQSFIYAPQIADFFYGNRIDLISINKTILAIKVLSLGLVLNTINQILLSLFYALKDTFTPSCINAIITAINISGNYFGAIHFGMNGVIFSTVTSYAIITPTFLFWLYRKHKVFIAFNRLTDFLQKSSLQICCFIFIQYFLQPHNLLSLGIGILLLPYPFIFATKKIFRLKLFLA